MNNTKPEENIENMFWNQGERFMKRDLEVIKRNR